jgi:GTP cyclohydrolase IA
VTCIGGRQRIVPNGTETTSVPVRDTKGLLASKHVIPRKITAADWMKFEGQISEILSAFGMDLETPGTRDTPRRFLQALFDATCGYEGDPKLLTVFPAERYGTADCRITQIIEGPISFFAVCEHHALPFHGKAYVGYIADEWIIGISKLTRLVRLFARRFTVQERMGQDIADHLLKLLGPSGVAVSLEATHLCTQMRGVQEEESRTWTSFWRGTYNDDPELRQEFLLATRTS